MGRKDPVETATGGVLKAQIILRVAFMERAFLIQPYKYNRRDTTSRRINCKWLFLTQAEPPKKVAAK
jgi:hypothetical protein